MKLLDYVSFTWPNPFESAPIPKDALSDVEGPHWVSRINDVSAVFQQWLNVLKDKVRILANGNKSPDRYDMFATIGEFLNLYNGYVERVAERTIWTAGRAYIGDKKVERIFQGEMTTRYSS